MLFVVCRVVIGPVDRNTTCLNDVCHMSSNGLHQLYGRTSHVTRFELKSLLFYLFLRTFTTVGAKRAVASPSRCDP
jgi:hypothetical protein